MTDQVLRVKLVVLGEPLIGKSSLLVRFKDGKFDETLEPTVAAAFSEHSVKLDGIVVKFEVWDTSGQERYKSLAPMYYRQASAALIMYDITSQKSFDSAVCWIQTVLRESRDCKIALVGNKADLHDRQEVDSGIAFAAAERFGCAIQAEVSARSGDNVENIFHELAVRCSNPESSKVLVSLVSRKVALTLAVKYDVQGDASLACTITATALSGEAVATVQANLGDDTCTVRALQEAIAEQSGVQPMHQRLLLGDAKLPTFDGDSKLKNLLDQLEALQ